MATEAPMTSLDERIIAIVMGRPTINAQAILDDCARKDGEASSDALLGEVETSLDRLTKRGKLTVSHPYGVNPNGADLSQRYYVLGSQPCYVGE